MLSGKKVTLRRAEPSDYPHIQRWQNDPEVFRWMDYEHPFSLDDIRASEERAIQEGHPFVIVAPDGAPVGRIGLNNIRARDRIASLYIFVGERSAWGQRYGLDALVTMLRYGFEVLNLRLVELWMLDGNERALHMYKTAGFTEDARIPNRSFHDGAYLDHIVLSIDADSFARASAALGY